MTRRTEDGPGQLAFDALLADTETANRARTERVAHAHLPGTTEAAVPYYRRLIETHHAAMLKGDAGEVACLRREALALAFKLNGFEAGILAHEDAPGYALARLTRAKEGTVPLWGQSGSFEIRWRAMRVRIEMEGLFGIGAAHTSWLGFAAHAVETTKPFLSDTGYRSFLGAGGEFVANHTPDSFATAVIETYVAKELKGRLRGIVPLCERSGAPVTSKRQAKAKKDRAAG